MFLVCSRYICVCLLFFSDKDVYSWGKSSRGRLGRSEENTTEPCKILFSGEEPFTVLDLACSHGNTLLCTKRKFFFSMSLIYHLVVETHFYVLGIMLKGCRGRDRMVVGYTTTCAISDYHH